MLQSYLNRVSLISALTFCALTSSFANYNGFRTYQSSNPAPASGGAFWASSQYIDMNTTTTFIGREWKIFTLNLPNGDGTPVGSGSAIVKGNRFMLTQGNATNQCFEISTSQTSLGGDIAETVNADTRLWFYDPSIIPTMVAVSDDFGGTFYSKVRIWGRSTGGSASDMIVTPYSAAYNNIDFFLNTRRLNYTTAAACQGTGSNFINASVWPNQYIWAGNR
jgi:hypothetical protein